MPSLPLLMRQSSGELMEGVTIPKLLVGLLTWTVLLFAPIATTLWILLALRRAPTSKVACMKLAAGVLLVAIAQIDKFPFKVARYAAGFFAALVGTADLVVSRLQDKK
jgi:hypothetical protein